MRAYKGAYLSLIYGFLYLPIAVLIVFSFNLSRYSLLWHGFSLRWYQALYHDPNILLVAWHSLEVGLIAATTATVLGMLGAVCLYRYRFLGKRWLDALVFILVIIPDLVLGIALLLWFSFAHVALGFWSLLIAHITLCIPFALITVRGRLVGFDKALIEAGRDLGASEWQIYYRILIPLLVPALVAAWLLSFTLSLDDVIISYFVSGPSFQILPLQIFSMVKLGATPELNALCSVIVVVTFSIAIISQRILAKKLI